MTNSENNYTQKRCYIFDELSADDTKRLDGIIEEFIGGFTHLSGMGPLVTIFGSAQVASDDRSYLLALELGGKLAAADIGVLTGGGPGIMEAANRGAYEAGGVSAGVTIDLADEQMANKYMTHSLRMSHFFVRKVMLMKYSRAFVMFPGGFGTLDELFEALNLVRTQRISPFPVMLVGSAYWQGLLDWLEGWVLKAGNIGKEDLDLIVVSDDLDEVARTCKELVEKSSG